MPRFAALLRGVNVGKANRLPMADFKQLLLRLGYTDVATLLNSGNAVFTNPDESAANHANQIAGALAETLGLKVSVVVKSSGELAAAVAGNPITVPEADHSKFLVAFANDRAALQALDGLQAVIEPPERLAVGPEAAYLYCASGLLDSKAGAALLGKVGKSVTTRNWATTLKLLALCDATAAD
jgi:uncharacterized protein (DUF1697 family)